VLVSEDNPLDTVFKTVAQYDEQNPQKTRIARFARAAAQPLSKVTPETVAEAIRTGC
jgi:hypothetical protein